MNTKARTTTGHMASIVGVCSNTIRRWCDAGMPHGYIGTWRTVSIEDVGRWLAKHRSYCVDGNFTALQQSRLCGLADRYANELETEAA